MKCLLCGSEKVIYRKTTISRFLMARIFGEKENSQKIEINLCQCEKCTFSFYDRRLTDDEEQNLYFQYRGGEYQRLREKYDCWYTKKVNNALNSDTVALNEQISIIKKMMKQNVDGSIHAILDYGGNKGDTLSGFKGIEQRYVYDISGVETVEGVNKITSYNDLHQYQFDFIMCNMVLEHISQPLEFMEKLFRIGNNGTYYYLEVPSENPFIKNKFSLVRNTKLLFNPYMNKLKLAKHYIHAMHEPICR